MGLLDMDMSRPEAQGFNNALLGMAQALLTPQARGGGMGAAFAAFPAAIDRAQQQSRQNKMLTLQEQQLGLQTDEAKRKAEAQARQQAALAKLLSDPAFANNPAAAALLGIGQADKAVERAFPDYKPQLGTVISNGREQPAWMTYGKPPEPVGEAKRPDPNKILTYDDNGNVVRNEPYIQARGDIAAKASPKITNVLPSQFPKVQDELDKQMGRTLVDRYDKQLVFAPAALENIEKAKALVAKSGGFVGSWGDKKLEVVQFLNNNLGIGIAPEEVNNASELRSRVFMGIMENLKKMDAQPSEMQQKVMQDALGRITTDPGALPRVLDVFGDIVRTKVKLHNEQVDAAGKNGIRFAYPIKVNVPAKTLPDKFSASNLQKGERYTLPDGRVGEWDGMTFKVVQ